MEWLTTFLKDKKKVRDIRTGITLVFALSLGILYIGFWGNVQAASFDLGLIGGLTVVSIVSTTIIRGAIMDRGEEDEREENQDLIKLESEIGRIKFLKEEDETVYDFLDRYNEQTQAKADRDYTDLKIRQIRNQVRKLKTRRFIPNQLINRLNAKIRRLEQQPLYYRWYKPITYQDLMRLDLEGWNKIVVRDRSHIRSNKRTRRTISTTLPRLITGAITSFAAIPFIVDDFWLVVRYYIMLAIIAGYTALKDYGWVRQHVKTIEVMLLENQLGLMSEAKQWVRKFNEVSKVEVVAPRLETQRKLTYAGSLKLPLGFEPIKALV
jgi:hypothetical protein